MRKCQNILVQQENQHTLSNVWASMFSDKLRTAWDARVWLLGFLFGNFAGLLIFCGAYPRMRRFVEAAFPYGAYGYYTGDFVLAAGLTVGLLIFPAVLAGKARRFYCLWALLPIGIVLL